MKIFFTGGGTGGHIYPIIAIIREIRRIYSKNELEFYYLGPKDEFGKILLSQEGIKIKEIFAGKIRRYLNCKSFFLNIIDVLIKIPLGIFQSFFYIFFLAPDLIFSKGGYGSLPPTISSWALQTPIFLHESDIKPGLVNKLMSRFSLKIFVSFSQTEYFPPSKTVVVGNPIRREILEGSKEEAKKMFKLSGEKPVILILGGSQGSQRINDMVLNILSELLEIFEIIHQCGEKNFKEIRSQIDLIVSKEFQKYYHLFPFLKEEQLKQAYAGCDLIVGRAGSGSIFEIAALGKPSILVPLSEAAQNHQIENAYTFARMGACIVIEEKNLTPHLFLEKLKYLFSHPEELEKMQKAAKEFSKPEAAREIAQYIINYLYEK